MTVGFMQPYFVPYLGYFDLIRQADQWVVFDTAQFIRRGWVNRNRVLKANGGWSYVTVPVKYAPLDTPIARMQIDGAQPWRQRILAQFDVIRRQAPYHEPVRAILEAGLHAAGPSLCDLNLLLLEKFCAYLGVSFRPRLCSTLALDPAAVVAPGDWALEVCRALGGTEYLNPPGGQALYDPRRFATAGISLRIQQFSSMAYATAGFAPEENLSILDVLAWNAPAAVMDHLNRPPPH